MRTSVCRGTVSGSAPLHSTTVRSPNGKRDRARRRAEAGVDEPAVLPRDLPLPHDAADRAPRAAARSDAVRRIRDDDLVQRTVDLLGRQPCGEVAGHVVEAERGQHGGLGLDPVVDQPDELLLPGRVEVVRAGADGCCDRREPDLQERPRTARRRPTRPRTPRAGRSRRGRRRRERPPRARRAPPAPRAAGRRASPRALRGAPPRARAGPCSRSRRGSRAPWRECRLPG